MSAAAAAEVGVLEATGLQLHEQIRFAGDRRWWMIRAVDDAHAVVTRQAAFEPRGVVVYTIVAHGQGVRGPCNNLGGGWTFEPTDLEGSAEDLLHALRESFDHTDRADLPEHRRSRIWRVEISRRRSVPLSIADRRPPAVHGAGS